MLILIDLVHLTFRNLKIQSSQIVDHLNHRGPVHADIFLDIKIQIGIEHLYRLFRTTMCICRIRFIVSSIADTQVRISIDGYKLNVFRLVIDACDHNDIGISCVIIVGASIVQTKQCNIRVSFQ